MRRADKSGARVAVIVGEDERARGAVLVRNLEDKSQTEISLGSLGDHVRRLLGDES
jgi:histidyl-tRNA synthetase